MTRPGIVLPQIDFTTAAAKVSFERDIIQGMIYYRYGTGKLVAVVGGRPCNFGENEIYLIVRVRRLERQ